MSLRIRHLIELLHEVGVDRLLQLIGGLDQLGKPVFVHVQVWARLELLRRYGVGIAKQVTDLVFVLDNLVS